MTSLKFSSPKGDPYYSSVQIRNELRKDLRAWARARGLSSAAVVEEAVLGVMSGRFLLKGIPPVVKTEKGKRT